MQLLENLSFGGQAPHVRTVIAGHKQQLEGDVRTHHLVIIVDGPDSVGDARAAKSEQTDDAVGPIDEVAGLANRAPPRSGTLDPARQVGTRGGIALEGGEARTAVAGWDQVVHDVDDTDLSYTAGQRSTRDPPEDAA